MTVQCLRAEEVETIPARTIPRLAALAARANIEELNSFIRDPRSENSFMAKHSSLYIGMGTHDCMDA